LKDEVVFLEVAGSTTTCAGRAGLTVRLSRSLAHKQTNGQLRSGRVGQLPCADWGYAFFGYILSKIITGGRLEHFYLAIVVMEPFQLDLGTGAEINEERDRIIGTAKVAKRLVMFLLCQ